MISRSRAGRHNVRTSTAGNRASAASDSRDNRSNDSQSRYDDQKKKRDDQKKKVQTRRIVSTVVRGAAVATQRKKSSKSGGGSEVVYVVEDSSTAAEVVTTVPAPAPAVRKAAVVTTSPARPRTAVVAAPARPRAAVVAAPARPRTAVVAAPVSPVANESCNQNLSRAASAAPRSNGVAVVTYHEVYDLAKDGRWEEMEEKLELRPEGARYVCEDDGNMLPLHCACSDSSISKQTISKLLKAYPEAATLSNEDGALPLHLCSKNHVTYDVFVLILMANPGAVFVLNGDNKAALWIVYLIFLTPDLTENKSRITSITGIESLIEHKDIHDMYKKAAAILFVSTCTCNKAVEVPTYLLSDAESMAKVYGQSLHITPACPPDLVRLSMKMFLETINTARNEKLVERQKIEEEAQILGLNVSYSDDKQQSFVGIAVASGISWSNGTESVVNSDTSEKEIKMVSRVSRLYPFASAAVGSRTDVETVFQLLRAYPGALSEAIPEDYVFEGEHYSRQPRRGGGPKVACACTLM